jgi:hypothetical protein
MPADTTEREERIRALARRMWDEAGRPEGRDTIFWEEAEPTRSTSLADRVSQWPGWMTRSPSW